MDGGAMALPVLGVVAIAAATFYAISFIELREKSFQALDDLDDDGRDQLESVASSRERQRQRERRAKRRKAHEKNPKK